MRVWINHLPPQRCGAVRKLIEFAFRNFPLQNYAELFRRIASWLRPGGLLFFHIFVHSRGLPYHYEVRWLLSIGCGGRVGQLVSRGYSERGACTAGGCPTTAR